ncbi:complement C1q-like protein 2 [Antedon mediterranea]|uniref:complement C1q-like protein 2 n=1 Tax=Antedon mediterranea TaxID=105859 RepID=UPI003AF44662
MYFGFKTFFILAVLQVINSTEFDLEVCNSCCTDGVPGIPGNNGIPGVSGRQGQNGEPGMKGEQGEKGEEGMKGDSGRNGSNGVPGEIGLQGPQGPAGESGPNGLPGESGLRGRTGSSGQKGQKGDRAIQRKSAFSAVFKTSPGRPTGILKYDTVVTNVGNHYNKNTGKFVCVIPGVYVFSVTSLSNNGNGFITYLLKNGKTQVTASMKSGVNTASTMVILDLVQGDQIWTEPNINYNYYISNINGHCSFSGFLLYAA